MTQTHTIFGAGQVGMQLARILASEGDHVRLVRRSAPGPDIDGVRWLQGDVTDVAFARAAAEGASVVYNCTNPTQYHRWDEILPPLTRAVRGAAARVGARLVVLDNLYMYGEPAGPMTEDTPMKPRSRKGELRKRLTAELFEAHARGEVEVTAGRASDFFGPATPNVAIFNPRFFERLAKGAAVEVMGDPDQPHSYSYTHDVARGLAILGRSDVAFGRAWHLPVAAQLTTRELIERFAAIADRQAKLRRVPTWLLRGLGAFVPLVGAVAEMTYQWDVPFVVDDSAFRHQFGVGPTPLDTAIVTTLEGHGVRSAQSSTTLPASAPGSASRPPASPPAPCHS